MAAPTTSAPPPLPPEEPASSNVPAYVTLGVAGAGIIVGTIFGIKALGDKSDFNSNPTSSKADDAERNALIADMAFGVAVTLGVTGTVLLLSNKGSSAPKTGLIPRLNSMQLTPVAGPHGGGAAAVWHF